MNSSLFIPSEQIHFDSHRQILLHYDVALLPWLGRRYFWVVVLCSRAARWKFGMFALLGTADPLIAAAVRKKKKKNTSGSENCK